MRMCKGKWKALTKRLEKLKKLNQAHTFNLYTDSDWGGNNVWSNGIPNLEAQGAGAAKENYIIYYLI